jgi:hypothetical protein
MTTCSSATQTWGTVGDFPGTLRGVQGMSTDQEGNLHIAEVDGGRLQKFRPRAGANPAASIGKPIYASLAAARAKAARGSPSSLRAHGDPQRLMGEPPCCAVHAAKNLTR